MLQSDVTPFVKPTCESTAEGLRIGFYDLAQIQEVAKEYYNEKFPDSLESIKKRAILIPFQSVKELLDATSMGQVDCGFLPIENSRVGSFPGIQSFWNQYPKISWTGEYLVARKELDSIWFQTGKPNDLIWNPPELNTGDDNIVTRFIEIRNRPQIPAPDESPKSTIHFTLTNSSGMLFKVISCFAMRDLNISKIESKPHFGIALHPWSLLFSITVDVGSNDQGFQKAFSQLKEYTTWTRLLGSYESKEARNEMKIHRELETYPYGYGS